ncbi:MAG: tetratricopeptide repeat protein, partial [Xanthomonadales bacterium]|nr:tetratricopeptide repeat protein [Xanthomonadales bacterium]
MNSTTPEKLARDHATQAEAAASRQEYQQASEFFAQAASTVGLDNSLQWQYRNQQALMLAEFGRVFRNNTALEDAISLYENTVLELAPREQRPDDWATTQHLLGNALGLLGQRQRATIMLERAIMVFEKLLSERTREQAPLEWATTLDNYGNVLGTLGQRRGNTEMLQKSVEAFESALEERTRELAPMDWAATQNNLGTALQVLGQREKDAKLLKRSVDAYKNALLEWTRERVPLSWATVFNNMGTV